MEYDPAESEYTVQTPVYHERSRLPVFLLIMSGMAAGAVAFWLLAVPAIKQGIYQEANQQIVQYSESLATQGAELTKVQGEAEESDNTAETVSKQLTEEQAKSKSYESLLTAYTFYQQQNLDEAAVAVKNVQVDVLPESLKPILHYDPGCYRGGRDRRSGAAADRGVIRRGKQRRFRQYRRKYGRFRL